MLHTNLYEDITDRFRMDDKFGWRFGRSLTKEIQSFGSLDKLMKVEFGEDEEILKLIEQQFLNQFIKN